MPQWDGKVIVWQPAKRATVTMEWLQPKIKEAMAAVDALSPVKRGLVHEFNLPWVWQYRKLADATILVEADKERERRKA